MGLADLIHRKKTATVLSPATAIPAIPAIVAPFPADIPQRIATIATIAVAADRPTMNVGPLSDENVSRQPDTASAFCKSYGGHCSVKATGAYPDDCIRTGCEHYRPETYPPGHIWHEWYEIPMPTDKHSNTCRCCKGVDFWQSIHGLAVCLKCHPPAPDAELL